MELSTEATEINDVTCNYRNVMCMAKEIYLHWFAVDSIQTLYLEHMSFGEHHSLAVLAVLEILFPWQLRITFITLAFEG